MPTTPDDISVENAERRNIKVSPPVAELIRKTSDRLGHPIDAVLETALLSFLDRTDAPYLVEEAVLVRELQQLQVGIEQLVHANYALATIAVGLDVATIKAHRKIVQAAGDLLDDDAKRGNHEE